MENENILEQTKNIAEYFKKDFLLNSLEKKDIQNWMLNLSFINTVDLTKIHNTIDSILSPIDDLKFSQALFLKEPANGVLKKITLNFPVIRDKFINSGIANQEVTFALRPVHDNNTDNLMKYFINVSKTDSQSLNNYNIASTFLLHCTVDCWKQIQISNPEAFKSIEIGMSKNNHNNNNILQEVARFNPVIYPLAKKQYSHIEFFPINSNYFFISNLQKPSNINIFLEEVKDLWWKPEYSQILFSTTFFQKKCIFIDAIKDKQKSEMNTAEFHLGEQLFLGANVMTELFNKNSAFADLQESFIHILENTKSSQLIAEVIYSLSCNSPQNKDLEQQTLNAIKNNPNDINIPFKDIFELRTVSRIYNDKYFLQELLDIPKIKLINKTDDLKDLLTNLSHQLYNIVHYSKQEIDLSNVSKNIKHLLENSDKEFYISYSFKEEEFSKHKIGDFLIVGNIKNKNGLLQNNVGTIRAKDPLDFIIMLDSMNDIHFNQVFSHKIPSMSSSNLNEQERHFLRDTILDKNKNTQVLSEGSPDVVAHNFIQLSELYSQEELTTYGFNLLMDTFKINLNALVEDNRFYLFLYEHRNIDLSIYGLDYNNPKILKTMAENQSLDMVEDLYHLLPNSKYKDDKENNLLMIAIKNKDHIGVVQLAKYYPNLSSEINKSKKMPIQLVLSKIKVMNENNDEFYKYSLMFKSLINYPLNTTPKVITEFSTNCTIIEDKIDKIVVGWREIITKNILDNALNNIKINNSAEKFNEDNENKWKI